MRALPPGRALSSRTVTVSFSFGRCMHAPHGASVIPLAAPVSTRGNLPLIPPHSTSVHRLGGSPESTPHSTPPHTHPIATWNHGRLGRATVLLFWGDFQGTFLPPTPLVAKFTVVSASAQRAPTLPGSEGAALGEAVRAALEGSSDRGGVKGPESLPLRWPIAKLSLTASAKSGLSWQRARGPATTEGGREREA